MRYVGGYFKGQFKVVVALVTVQLLFGVNYIATKAIIGLLPPLVWASFRIIISTAILLGIALFSSRKRPALTLDFFIPLVAYSLLGIVINQASFLIGLKYTTATNSAVLNTLIPVFTLIFVTISGQKSPTPRRILGFLIAFSGVLAIRKVEDFTLSNATLFGDALILLNCASYGLFLTLSRKFIKNYDSVWITTWLFIVGSFGLTGIAIPGWLSFHWPPISPLLFGYMAFSVLGCTLLAYFLNIWALARTESFSVAFYVYLQPVVASALAWVYLGESMTFRTFVSTLLILTGMITAFKDS